MTTVEEMAAILAAHTKAIIDFLAHERTEAVERARSEAVYGIRRAIKERDMGVPVELQARQLDNNMTEYSIICQKELYYHTYYCRISTYNREITLDELK